MATNETRLSPATTRGRATHITLWVTQILLAAFFVLVAALPKLLGARAAVESFDDIGAGQWFRYLVGVLELAGGIGLVIPRLAGLAALGLAGVMAGATFTQLFVLDSPVLAIGPFLLGVVLGLVAWGRWPLARTVLGWLRSR